MTEAQKYQGALYKNKNNNKRAKTTETSTPSAPKAMAHAAYVEDVADDYEQWRDYEYDSGDDNMSPANLPEAPTPPLQDEANVNVFDYLVGHATPTASNVSLPRMPVQLSEDTQLVRFDAEKNEMIDEEKMEIDALVRYGTGPVPVSSFQTPAPKGERKKKDSDKSELKKDKKRKRLHVDTGDKAMTDAPPVLHSGLTGGLNKLMSRNSVFPPSPDYSGDNVADTPANLLKKTKKHSKHRSETATIGSSLIAMIGGSKPTTKKRKHTSTTSPKKHREHRHRIEGPKDQKMLEYRPGSKDSKDGGPGAMVLYKPRAEHFLSFVNKGPESEKGTSLNKALKRYHRERSDSGHNTMSKLSEEKELFRSLRLRKNDRGEIVLFSV